MVRPNNLHLLYPNRPQTSQYLADNRLPALNYGKNWRSIIEAYRENAVKWVVNGIMTCFPNLQYDDPRTIHLHTFARDLENRISVIARDLADYFDLINTNIRLLRFDLQRQEFIRFQKQITAGG